MKVNSREHSNKGSACLLRPCPLPFTCCIHGDLNSAWTDCQDGEHEGAVFQEVEVKHVPGPEFL